VLGTEHRVWHDVADALLDGREWAHRTSRVRALGWDFGVRTNVAALGAHLDVVLGAMRADGEPAHWYSLIVTPRRGWQRHRLYRDGDRILDTPDPARAFLYLLWDVNQRVFRSTNDRVLVHAAAVAHEGRAVLLSAPSGSGKTTLSLGLVERGLGYLTDEAAALDPATLLVHPFPKALSVEVGAQPFLERHRPTAVGAVADYLHGQWQVPPSSIRASAVSGAARPAWVVIPPSGAGSETALVPLSRAEALSLLLEQTLNLHVHGRAGFEALAEAVRGCRCFRLVMGDHDSACDAILAMLAESVDDA
jgi:hypothetical protein